MKTIKEQGVKESKIGQAETAAGRRRAADAAAASRGRLGASRKGEEAAQFFKMPKGDTIRQAAVGAARGVTKGQKKLKDPLYNKKQVAIKAIEKFGLSESRKKQAIKSIEDAKNNIEIANKLGYWKAAPK